MGRCAYTIKYLLRFRANIQPACIYLQGNTSNIVSPPAHTLIRRMSISSFPSIYVYKEEMHHAPVTNSVNPFCYHHLYICTYSLPPVCIPYFYSYFLFLCDARHACLPHYVIGFFPVGLFSMEIAFRSFFVDF